MDVELAEVALVGYNVVIVSEATPGRVYEAMMQKPELKYWSLAGHGTGGELAAKIALTLQPRVKSLVLIGAALPPSVDFRSISVFLTMIYGDNDTITTPTDVTKSLSRVQGELFCAQLHVITTIHDFSKLISKSPSQNSSQKGLVLWTILVLVQFLVAGDAAVTKIPGFGHYNFAYSLCTGNEKTPSNENSGMLNSISSAAVTAALQKSVGYAQWFAGTEKALSFGDNHYLTPGFNDSKRYPGDIRVHFDELPIPDTLPQV